MSICTLPVSYSSDSFSYSYHSTLHSRWTRSGFSLMYRTKPSFPISFYSSSTVSYNVSFLYRTSGGIRVVYMINNCNTIILWGVWFSSGSEWNIFHLRGAPFGFATCQCVYDIIIIVRICVLLNVGTYKNIVNFMHFGEMIQTRKLHHSSSFITAFKQASDGVLGISVPSNHNHLQ